MKSDMTIKDPFAPTAQNIVLKEAKKVRVKFNFPVASPNYDSSVALKRAKEEKSYIPFEAQSHIDLNTVSNFYEAGQTYDVSEDFYTRFAERKVETFNSNFGNFTGKSVNLIKRPIVPYLIKIDSEGNYVNPLDRDVDLYP